MKWVTFAAAFVLTICFVIAGVLVYPEVLGQAATANNEFVFALFLGPFSGILFICWLGEKVVLKVFKKE